MPASGFPFYHLWLLILCYSYRVGASGTGTNFKFIQLPIVVFVLVSENPSRADGSYSFFEITRWCEILD